MGTREQTRREWIENLEDALAKMDELATLLKPTGDDDEYFRRTVIADLEGRNGGWLGESLRDRIEKKLEQEREELEIES